MATYPAGINLFSTKRNLTDNVLAEHVNELQAEVTAIQNALGIFPQRDRTLNARENDYTNVRGRFEAISRGQHVPIIRLESPTENVGSNSEIDINFDLPNVANDPFSMFNGIGFTVKRGGWWIITSDIAWATNPNGDRFHAIMDGTVERSALVTLGSNYWKTRTNVVWQGPLANGRKITTRVRHNAGTTLSLNVTLAASFVREVPGVTV